VVTQLVEYGGIVTVPVYVVGQLGEGGCLVSFLSMWWLSCEGCGDSVVLDVVAQLDGDVVTQLLGVC
jgi:hypothetical protein